MLALLPLVGLLAYSPGNGNPPTGSMIGPETVKNFAGYETVRNSRNLFYWFFESRDSPSTDPFILWMTGGPGCSGMLALLVENGPYKVQHDGSLALNPYSWNSHANILFIDQPVGTGFSYNSNKLDLGVTTETQMAEDMFEFFENFFSSNPQYASLPFFIAAESYGGHYAPALAYHIQKFNSDNFKINLKGVLIGDGLVDPIHQYPSYVTYAKEHNSQIGLSQGALALMEAALVPCLPLAAACGGMNNTCQKCNSPKTPDGTCAPPADDPKGKPCCSDSDGFVCTQRVLHWTVCQNAYEICTLGELIPIQGSGINLYDVTKPCVQQPLCYDFDDQNNYLNDKATISALGAHAPLGWTSCNRAVEIKLVFAGDWMISYKEAIRSLLEAEIPVLIYHGENDIIVNWMGGDVWTRKLPWSGQAGFLAAPNTTFVVDGDNAGTYRSYNGLTFMKLANAGHLAPMDAPEATLQMLQSFMDGKPF